MENNNNPESLNFQRLATEIWTRPSEVIREIVDHDPKFGQRDIFLLLSAASGLLALPLGIEMVILEALLNLVLLLVTTYSMAVLLWLTAKYLGGHGSITDLCAAMVWPMIPAIWGTLVAFLLSALSADTAAGGFPVGDVVQGLFYLFSFHLMVHTVAEVQQFSPWRSFFSQLIALVISCLPIFIFWNQLTDALKPLVGF